jgi:hypothetical protein
MPVVNLEPDNTHPIPFDTDDQEASTFAEEVAVAANTVEAQVALGASLDVDAFTEEREKNLIEQVVQNRQTKHLASPNTAFAAAAFLRTYGQQLAMNAAQARSAITNKLMEIANCGDPRYELKALELLGKHSDIGLFTERSEITINYKDPTELENAIKERVKRLLNADIVDVTPIGADLDDQLGVAGDVAPPLMDELNAEPAQKAPVDDNGSTSAQ